jgi:soluble lytic murein transglycosylase-like protein
MPRLILEYSVELGLDPKVVEAICQVESSGNWYACRYEPKWSYFYDTAGWAKLLRQTEATEKMQQATSWGPMQVMGSVAREHGFRGYLTELAVTNIGLRYGCLHLRKFLNRYPRLDDAISAYNQGNPRKDGDGLYVNQGYVDKVFAAMKK